MVYNYCKRIFYHDDDGESNTVLGSKRELPGGEREAAATCVKITPESSD
jgi:hypothetical protein